MRELLPVFSRALTESWRGTLGWTVGIAAVLLMYLPLFPSIGGNGQMQQIIESLPPELVNALGYDQIGTGAGYVQGTFYGLIGFLLVAIAATSWGASAIAGAEESGRLELDLAHGIGRVRYALESAGAILVRVAWLGVFAAIVVALLNDSSALDLDLWQIAQVTVVFIGLSLLSGSVALCVGAIWGRRSVGVAAGAVVAVGGYAFNAIANQSEDAAWLRAISPYAWAYHRPPLADGLDPVGAASLWGLSSLFIAVGAWALRRRDLVG